MEIFVSISTVITCLFLTLIAITLLDYLFGLDKLSWLIDFLNADLTHVIHFTLMTFACIIVSTGYALSSESMVKVGSIYMMTMLFLYWVVVTVIYMFQGVSNLRKYCLKKRKKPR